MVIRCEGQPIGSRPHIYEAAERAAEVPEIGHRGNDVSDPTLRFLSVHSYVIVYCTDDSTVDVIRVLSGYQDLGSVLDA